MRITHVSHELPPYELAGTAIYTLNIAKAQAAAGHEVSVFARLQDPEIPDYRMHDENRDGLDIRFVNRADIEWVPLERSYRDDRMKEIFGAFLDETRTRRRPLPAPGRARHWDASRRSRSAKIRA